MTQYPSFPALNKEVLISCCIFSSFVLRSETPFIGAKNGQFCFVEDCLFRNISSSNIKESNYFYSIVHEHVSNTEIEGVSSPIQGTILNGFTNTGGLCVTNTTFFKCSVKYIQPSRVNTSGAEPIAFDNTIFDSFSETYGGAIWHNVNCTLSINNCDFINCSCKQSGAAIYIGPTVSSHVLINNSFANDCKSDGYGGFFLRDYDEGTIIEKCNCTMCSCVTTGGCIYLNRIPQNSLIEQCLIQSCAESQGLPYLSGGGILIGDSTNVTITDCMIINCTAAHGGGIDFCGDGNYGGEWTAFITFCYFELNSARVGAKDISFRGNWIGKATENVMVECRSMTLGNRLVMCGDDDMSSWIHFGHFDAIKVNSQDGIDQLACGRNKRKCKTISFSFKVIDTSKNLQTIISVDPFTYAERNCLFVETNIVLESSGSEIVIVTSAISAGSLFEISTCSLSVTSFKVIHNVTESSKYTSLFSLSSFGSLFLTKCFLTVNTLHSTDNRLEESLLVLSSGNVQIISTTISNFIGASKAAISFSDSCELHLANSTLFGITRQRGSGSGIEGTVGTDKSLIIEGGIWNECCSTSGNGGGMNLKMNANSRIMITPETNDPIGSFFDSCHAKSDGGDGGLGGGIHLSIQHTDEPSVIFESITFSSCTAVYGSNIFVNANNLSFIAHWNTFVMDINLFDTISFHGFERSTTNETFSIPLVTYLRSFSAPSYVAGETGHDYSACGFSDYPCSSIEYASSLRFSNEKRIICLLSPFEIERMFIIDQQQTQISVEQPGTKIKISHDINEAGENIIETKKHSSFQGICFSLPASFTKNIKYIFHCFEMNLTLAKCSFVADSGNVDVSLIVISKGYLNIENLNLCELTFGMSPVIEIKGSESSCSCDALKLDNIVMQYLSEFIDICDGERLVINNSKFNCIDMGANGMLVIQNSDVIEIESSLFTSINRTSGGGGGVAGSIGDGKSMIVRNCTFEQCSSSEVARISGGGLNVEVCDRGSFLFSNNTVNSCCVNEEFGVGGGIHLKFCKEDVTYSMKQISFSDCNAYLGKDVFLICPSPRDVLVIQLWEGTSKEIEDPLNKWVIDVEIDPNINRSVLYFLFPPRLSMVYVKNEGSGDPRCGDDLDPCGDLMFGFNKMSTDQTTIQIIDSCILDEVLDRNGLSLTIRGQSSTSQSTFDIETDGTISLKIEANSASMMLSYLKFNIPMTSSVGHLISIDGGKLFVDECFFGRKDDTMIEADALIVFASKGTIKFSKVSLRKISFKEAGGIISMIGGSLDIENSDWSFLEARASALHLLNNENFKVSENCTFTSCLSDSEEGGFMKCSLQATGKMSIANSSITKSGMIESRGRGGGLHLSLPNGSTNDYLIANVSFVNNSAEFGKDIFIVCDNLNTSITLEQFKIRLMNDDGQKAISMMGNDRNYFNDSAHDLYLFLIQFQSQEIIVSSSGYDMQGCGSEMYPCYSFSRGFSNILQDAVQKRLTIITETYVDHSHVLSSFIIAPSNTLENCSLAVSSTISGVPSESIFLNNDELLVKKAIISLPSFFCSGQKALFLSSSKEEYGLTLSNCSFEFISSNSLCQFYLIRSTGGYVCLSFCTFQPQNFYFVPFSMKSSFSASNCKFCGLSTAESLEGGSVSCHLSSDQAIQIQDCIMDSCMCSETFGRGGFLFVNCIPTNSIQPFSFVDVIFCENNAHIGKSIFVETKDLNTTVTNMTFNFDYLSFAEDSNVFVGSDAKNKDTNLFRFLVSYSSNVIFISINGSDVSKCGQKFDPCETFWKGMSQIDGNAEKKVMLIENSSFVQNAYDLSNYSFSSANLEKETKSELILKKPETFEILDWIFSCTGTLSFMCIDMQLDETLAEFTGVIINFKGSSVSIENCFLCSSSSIYYLDMKFVSVQSGILKLISFEVHQLKFDSTALEIWSCSSCSLTDVIVLNSVINGGFIRFIDNSTSSGNELPTIEINKSVFQNVSSTINGSCIITCTSTSSCNALINDSLFDACQSEASEKGGVIMFILGSESYYKLHNSKISSCSCSLKNGKGGGVYIKAEGNESLNLTFLKCEFQRNNAWKGRDIFVECWSIEEQINETQFQLDLRPDVYNRFDAIYGCDNRNQNPVDLIDYVTIYQQSTIIVSSSHEKNGTNGRQCGKIENPCLTVELGLRHLIFDYLSRILIDDIGNITSECNIVDMEMKSLGQEKANVMIHPSPFKSRECMILFENNVLIGSICFYLPSDFSSQHSILFLIVSGKTSFQSCGFCGTENISSISPILISSMDSELIFDEAKMSNLNCPRIAECKSGRIQLRQLKLDRIFSSKSTILLKEMNGFAEKLNISNCTIHSGSFFGIESDPSSEWAKVSNSLEFSLINISCISSFDSASCFDCCLHENQLSLQNCSLSGCHQGNVELGSAAIFENCSCLRIKSCLFEGDLMSEGDIEINEISEQSQLCKWNSSLIFFENSVISINDSSISNSSKGGIAASRSTISVSEGKFFNNNPLIQNYSSTRRNIICSNSGVLDITSLKGGDGLKENSSLWVLNLGCSLSGIASERASPFFIPQLASVKSRQQGNTLAIDLAGSLLLPCGLSLQVDSFDGSVHNLQVYPLQAEEFAGEVEIHTAIPASIVTTASEATEVSVKILFGRVESPASTDSFILKNRSEPKANGDERIVEGGKEGKSYWMLIAIVLVVILLIFLIGFILFVVRWKKAKERSDELEEIVKDTVKKDPKLIEMVTMEMSPEAQWRRAEKEAEKKNDERFKKRVIEKSLGHSESSEHLLSESGSTEYILGRDSDKIPQWMLEKVDEKEEDDEETRKRTPSPSISSTCSTDSDSTFVRTESLCPTTSSMSNLVDAMACSSPHEKLIVDLRDSLFMLLHGRNEKKEMAIGSLKEREQTAAQILFWVANLALHSFDEMENPLSSLANLSPHIVLFSEHMVICIAMHSDCSSNGSDSDSSSVFSCSSDCSTVSDDDRNSLPSSAFEDDEDNRYECLRWKAPELQTNKKMGATKESVVFSIGMMLWECLTLKIPFSDYEAELAGQKIQRGDLPNFDMMLTHSSSFSNLVSTSLSFNPSQRPTIENVKRHTIVHFPPDAVLLTASDAIDFQEDESNRDCQSDSCTDKTSLISF